MTATGIFEAQLRLVSDGQNDTANEDATSLKARTGSPRRLLTVTRYSILLCRKRKCHGNADHRGTTNITTNTPPRFF
jgi:hypothetical protein